MHRFWQWCTDGRVIAPTALLFLALAWAQGTADQRAWLLLALCGGLLLAAAWYGWRRWRALPHAASPAPAEDPVLRQRVHEAVATIKASRLGLARGAAALYELPWYMVIGSPGAGKSSLLAQSGLHFPITDTRSMEGQGGTRDLDWFFSNEGIVLDTAGRYTLSESEQGAWRSLLKLVKKQRPKAPLNGVLIAVSVSEICADPIALANTLRGRVHELTQILAVQAPVYVLLTKADLIPGFADAMHDLPPEQREAIWGATLRYDRRRQGSDVRRFFDTEFGLLCEGLHSQRLARMAGETCLAQRPGIFSFAEEFAQLQAPLGSFLSVLFDENAYQLRPVFRGFYFTSARPQGEADSQLARQVAARFGLSYQERSPAAQLEGGYFLRRLFQEVIFADKELVRRYRTPMQARLRWLVLALILGGFGSALGWWTWAYRLNQSLLAETRADVARIQALQEGAASSASRLEALELVQARIAALQSQRKLASAGLYAADALEGRLRRAYFAGVRQVLLAPAQSRMEAYLSDSATAADEQAYKALKAYLMLADPARVEPALLAEQLIRFGRDAIAANSVPMPRGQMQRLVESMVGFVASQGADPAWPRATPRMEVVDQMRDRLRGVAQAMPYADRVYAEIKSRAASRYAPISVDTLLKDRSLNGSAAVSGAFTRAAWEGFVRDAMHTAAYQDGQGSDWVLQLAHTPDLNGSASPAQLEAALLERYKSEYAQAWRSFLQGVGVAAAKDPGASLPQVGASIEALLAETVRQTGFDSLPAVVAQTGILAWIRKHVLRAAAPPPAALNEAAGSVAAEFSPLAKMIDTSGTARAPMGTYLDALGRVRARLQQLALQGDAGPGARQWVQQTLDAQGSELSDALKQVDEQLLAGLKDPLKQALRPLLVRPLMMVYAGLLPAAETEVNRVWLAQVQQPFQTRLADKYPFSVQGVQEAGSAEIGQIFGPEVAIARFAGTALAGLVLRRGDTLSPRTWAGLGIRLHPQVLADFPGWVAPLSQNGIATDSAPSTVFQLLPQASPGLAGYTIDIDGQVLQYQGGQAAWVNMQHPAQGVPGVRIHALTTEGRRVEVFQEAGLYGLKRMIEAATRSRKPGGVFGLQWQSSGVSVNVDLKIVSTSETGTANGRGFSGLRLPEQLTAGEAP